MTDANAGSVQSKLEFQIADAIKDMKRAVKEASSLTDKMEALEDSAEGAARAQDKSGKSSKRAGKGAKDAGRDAEKGADGFRRFFRSADHGADGVIGKISDMRLAVAGIVSAMTVGGGAVAFQLARQGAELQQQTRAFENIIGGVFKAEEALKRLREASGFSVLDSTLQRLAVRAQQTGISFEDAATLTEIARAAAIAYGRDVEETTERVIQAVAKRERELLDEIGLIVGEIEAQERFAEATGKTVQQLTEAEKTQAFLNETIRQGEFLINKIGDATEGSATEFAKFGTTLGEIWSDGTQLLSGVLLPMVTTLNSLSSAAKNTRESMRDAFLDGLPKEDSVERLEAVRTKLAELEAQQSKVGGFGFGATNPRDSRRFEAIERLRQELARLEGVQRNGFSQAGVVDPNAPTADQEKAGRDMAPKLELMSITDASRRQIRQLEIERDALIKSAPQMEAEIVRAYQVSIDAIRQKRAEMDDMEAERVRKQTKREADAAIAAAQTVQRERMRLSLDALSIEERASGQIRDAAVEHANGRVDLIEQAEMAHIDRITEIRREQLTLEKALIDESVENTELAAIAKANAEAQAQQDITDARRDAAREVAKIEEDITEKQARELDKRKREAERAARQQANAIRRVLDPLFSGGDGLDSFKRLIQEDFSTMLSNSLAGVNQSSSDTILGSLFQGRGGTDTDRIVEATEKTAKQTEETAKGVGGLPVSMGNIFGAMLGGSVGGGGVSGKSIGMTFLGSLAGGFTEFGLSGGFAPQMQQRPSPDFIGAMPMASMTAPRMASMSAVGGAVQRAGVEQVINIDNRNGGRVDKTTLEQLKPMIKGVAQQTVMQADRAQGAIARNRKSFD